MAKQDKGMIIFSFVLAVLIFLTEVFLSITTVIELKTHNDVFTALGFVFITIVTFPFLVCSVILSVITFLDTPKTAPKNAYYKLAKLSFIISIVTVVLVLSTIVYVHT